MCKQQTLTEDLVAHPIDYLEILVTAYEIPQRILGTTGLIVQDFKAANNFLCTF